MADEKDPLLERKGYGNPSQESLSGAIDQARTLLGLTVEKIKLLGESFSEIYRKNNCTKNAKTMIDGTVFAFASRNFDNPEWRGHCSGSLRGLIEECAQSDKMSTWFCNTFNHNGSNGFPSKTTHPNEYKKLEHAYNYFSEIHHHSTKDILYKLQDLYGANIKAGDDTEERFIQTAKEYLDGFHSLFNQPKSS